MNKKTAKKIRNMIAALCLMAGGGMIVYGWQIEQPWIIYASMFPALHGIDMI